VYDSLTIHAAAPPIEARVTEPADPGTSHDGAHQGALATAYWQLGVFDQWGDQRISPETALTYSAVWACVRVIAESLSGVGWHAYERKPENQRFKFPILDDVAWLLQLQANPETSAFDWRQVMLKDALTWGNGYAEIERTMSGKPLWLWQLDPGRVEVVRDGSQLWYEVDNGPGTRTTRLRPENVFHLKGLGPDGLVGWSIVELARKSIKLGLQEEKFGSDFFGRGVNPGGMVTIPGHVTNEARKKFRKDFEALYAGESNQRRVVVVSDGITFTPMSLPNNDAQFLESRTFQVNEICRWYGVPPHKLADLTRATFSNIEEQERAFVADCLLPWARRLESEADIKLFGPVKRGRRFTRLNLDALMRGNSQTQTDTVTKKVASGLLTLDEGREYFDLNPYDKGLGETPIIQGAMVPLERILEEPEPPPAPMPAAPPPGEPQPPADPEAIRRVFGCLLTDAYARLLRVDADKARRAANKGKLAEHVAEWYAEPAATERVQATFRDIFVALGFALNWPSHLAGEMAHSAAAQHVDKVCNDLERDGIAAVDAWASWPSEAATLDLKGIS
jgi:HK97 family phage portal protein